MTLDVKPLEDYFQQINTQEKQDMSNAFDLWDKEEEEPLTQIYFSIKTPASDHYPAHEHNMNVVWQDGASWIEMLWEVMKVMEASYNYDIKSKVLFKVVDQNIILAEQEHGNPDIAKQMFTDEDEE